MHFFHKHIRYAVLACFDAGLIMMAMYVSCQTLYGVGWCDSADIALLYKALPIVVVFVLMNLSLGVYESRTRALPYAIFQRVLISTVSAFLLGSAALSVINLNFPYSLPIVAAVIVALCHTLCRNWGILAGRLTGARQRVLIVGAGERASFIARRMRRSADRRHFVLLGFVAHKSSIVNEDIKRREHVISIQTKDLARLINEVQCDTLVLATENGDEMDMDGILGMVMKGVRVVHLENFVEKELFQVAVESMPPDRMVDYTCAPSASVLSPLISRTLDIVSALLLLLLTWPVMLMAVAAIYFDDGKRAAKPSFLYRQQRVGKGGRPFDIIKFRSMKMNAESEGAKWADKNDARVTRVGKYLRKYRIDELPQLVNVLKGEMSFVGPRPERPEFTEKLSENIPYFHLRHTVKPGLTGWAQIRYPYGASEKDSMEKLKFDLYYIKHRSVGMNLLILLRTTEVVLFGQGR